MVSYTPRAPTLPSTCYEFARERRRQMRGRKGHLSERATSALPSAHLDKMLQKRMGGRGAAQKSC
jgi:hypothetical protein